MLVWEISAFWAVFLQMSIIAPLLAFLHFMEFEAIFSREINVNMREKSVHTRPSRHRVSVNIKSPNERKSKKNCYEQKKSANRRSRYILTNNDIYPYDITNIKEQMKEWDADDNNQMLKDKYRDP